MRKSARKEREASSSPSQSETESDIELAQNQNGSRKRRRTSLDSDEDDAQSSKPLVPVSSTHSTISRIQAKTRNAPAPKPVEEEEDSSLTTPNGTATTKSTFTDLGVDPWLVASLSTMAIKRPTGIQKGCIPEILKGRDCIGGSRTGSGKTVAFAVPILQQWARDPIGIFAVVMTPTRELALQIYEQFNAIAAPMSCKLALITGGTSTQPQAITLSTRPHIVICTPGRLASLISTSGTDTTAGLRRVRYLVLDEADRLLSTGPGSMLPDIETCLSHLPPSHSRQTLLFTATLTPEVRALETAPQDPKNSKKPPPHICEIDIGAPSVPPTLKQTYLLLPSPQKESFLHILLSTPRNLPLSTIIFVNRTTTAHILEHILRALSHRVTSLHSALPQQTRTSNLARFRTGAARILIATDVAARGLDIPEVKLVVNYDVPRDPDAYIHRVGRTARAGRWGCSVTMVGQRDVDAVKAIEARVGAEMVEYQEEGVNLETRVLRDGLKIVGEKKREALVDLGEGRDVRGKRVRGMVGLNKRK